MSFVNGLILFTLFLGVPCAIAAWLGTLVRHPLIAFVLAWLLTPILTLVVVTVFWPILRALTPENNDGSGAFMLPFIGIVTGFVAGIVAGIIVGRRRNNAVATATALDGNTTGGTSTEADRRA